MYNPVLHKSVFEFSSVFPTHSISFYNMPPHSFPSEEPSPILQLLQQLRKTDVLLKSLDLAEGSRWILYCNRSSADTFLPDLSTPINTKKREGFLFMPVRNREKIYGSAKVMINIVRLAVIKMVQRPNVKNNLFLRNLLAGIIGDPHGLD